jgi:hypothetical protein
MHTSEVSRCASSTAGEMIRAYADKGYTGVIVTDHFVNGNCFCNKSDSWKEKMECFYKGYQNAKSEGDKLGLDVFFGWEFNYMGQGDDLVTFGPDIDFLLENPKITEYSLEEYSGKVHEAGGYIIHAHPFREASYISKEPTPRKAPFADGMEVYNGSGHKNNNDKAFIFATENNLKKFAGSDAHNTDAIDTGIYLPYRTKTIQEFIECIKNENIILNN